MSVGFINIYYVLNYRFNVEYKFLLKDNFNLSKFICYFERFLYRLRILIIIVVFWLLVLVNKMLLLVIKKKKSN